MKKKNTILAIFVASATLFLSGGFFSSVFAQTNDCVSSGGYCWDMNALDSACGSHLANYDSSCGQFRKCCSNNPNGGVTANACETAGGACLSESVDSITCGSHLASQDSACEAGYKCCDTSSGVGSATSGSSGTNSSASSLSGTVDFPDQFGLPDPAGGIEEVITTILNWLLGIIGMIAIIAFVISGFQYIFSVGNETQMQTAKRNMTYSIIGVVVALAGLVIVQAVDNALKGGSLF